MNKSQRDVEDSRPYVTRDEAAEALRSVADELEGENLSPKERADIISEMHGGVEDA